jgi:hypothetical protein
LLDESREVADQLTSFPRREYSLEVVLNSYTQRKNITVNLLRGASARSRGRIGGGLRRHYVGLTTNVAAPLEWPNTGQNEHTVRDRPW